MTSKKIKNAIKAIRDLDAEEIEEVISIMPTFPLLMINFFITKSFIQNYHNNLEKMKKENLQ